MRKTSVALFFATTLFFATSAFAGTWYVAPGGNDNNTGTATSAPLATITKGVSKLSAAGDTLYVRAGTYHEFVLIWSKNGASGNNIKVLPYNNESVIIDVAGVSYTGNPPAVVAIDSCTYVTVGGFDLRNGPDAGVRVRGSSYTTVQNNTIHGNQSFGISATTPSANTRGSAHDISAWPANPRTRPITRATTAARITARAASPWPTRPIRPMAYMRRIRSITSKCATTSS
jgi:parallel beta-helix repeat protein